LSIESKKIKARLNHCSAREVEEGEKRGWKTGYYFQETLRKLREF